MNLMNHFSPRTVPARIVPARIVPARTVPARTVPARIVPARIVPVGTYFTYEASCNNRNKTFLRE